MGELIQEEQDAGRLATRVGDRGNQHTGGKVVTDDIASLPDLGISRDRSARAQKLADVPAEQFEAALPVGGAQSLALLDRKPFG